MKEEIKELNKRSKAGVVIACLLFAAAGSCSSGAGSMGGNVNKAPQASSAPLDFTLVNLTGFPIHAVYVSPHSSEGWEENLLGGDKLIYGGTVGIRFSPEEKAVMWDLRAEDEDGNNTEWKNLNLREISSITLRLSEGVAIAEVE